MNTFRFVTRKNIISTLVTFATLLPSGLAAKELSMALFFTQNSTYYSDVFAPFAQEVEEISSGQLTIKIYSGGALSSDPRAQYSAVTQGIADMAFGMPGYTAELFPISNTISMPQYIESAVDGTNKVWNAIDLVSSEYDAKVLALWTSNEAVLITRDIQVNRLEDLAGLKVRVAAGSDAPFVRELGASPVSQPVTVLNQNLSNGVIDGIFIGAGGITHYKLWEGGTYITTGVPMSPAVFFFIMNQDVYNGLTPQEQSWIDQASGRTMSLTAAKVTAQLEARGLAAAVSNGTIITELSDFETLRLEQAITGSIETFLAEEIRPGLLRSDVVKMMNGN